MRRTSLVTVLAVLLAVALIAAVTSVAGEKSSLRTAYDFELKDINPKSASHGQTFSLKQLYAERGVVLNFVASWCGPCWLEAPHMEKIRNSAGEPIVAIAADEYSGDTGDVIRLAGKAGLTMPLLHVPREQIEEMEKYYNHSMLPSTYVIDRKGQIRKVVQGMISEEQMRQVIDTHLQ